MRKSSVATRKYMERLALHDPEHAAYINYRRRFSSAKSFIKLHAKKPELLDIDKILHSKLEGMKENEAPKSLN